MALALFLVLSRDDLDETTAVGWLDPARALFASCAPGPVPAEASTRCACCARCTYPSVSTQSVTDDRLSYHTLSPCFAP